MLSFSAGVYTLSFRPGVYIMSLIPRIYALSFRHGIYRISFIPGVYIVTFKPGVSILTLIHCPFPPPVLRYLATLPDHVILSQLIQLLVDRSTHRPMITRRVTVDDLAPS
ncbi:hypothetical protein EGW08_015681, partial [Elysia chlorotica]